MILSCCYVVKAPAKICESKLDAVSAGALHNVCPWLCYTFSNLPYLVAAPQVSSLVQTVACFRV